MKNSQKRVASIEKMKLYPYRCKITTKGFKCAYRALFPAEIKKHMNNHRASIKSGIRTNARFYEIPVITNPNANACPNMADELVTIVGPKGNHLEIAKATLLRQIEKRFKETVVSTEEEVPEISKPNDLPMAQMPVEHEIAHEIEKQISVSNPVTKPSLGAADTKAGFELLASSTSLNNASTVAQNPLSTGTAPPFSFESSAPATSDQSKIYNFPTGKLKLLG